MVDVVSVVVSVVPSVVASVVASVLYVEYRYKREDSRKAAQERDDWYAQAAELGRDVQSTWRTKFQRPNRDGGRVNYDEVRREMNLYSSQLSNHASRATHLEVADEVVIGLETTAEACREVYEIRADLNSHPVFEERGDAVIEAANQLEERALAEL